MKGACYRLEVAIAAGRRRSIVLVADDEDHARIRAVGVGFGFLPVREILSVEYLHPASDHTSETGRRRIRGY